MSIESVLAVKILKIAGIANIIFIFLVFFSCRCLAGSKITNWLFQKSWYKKFILNIAIFGGYFLFL